MRVINNTDSSIFLMFYVVYRIVSTTAITETNRSTLSLSLSLIHITHIKNCNTDKLVRVYIDMISMLDVETNINNKCKKEREENDDRQQNVQIHRDSGLKGGIYVCVLA